jgi:hypothetical protein
MKKGYLRYTLVAVALLVVPVVAGAVHFDYEIYGNMLDTPAEYTGGGLTSGGTGIIEIYFDETGWPTDPNQRWNYLWQNYWKPNYDTTTVGAYKWVGTFTGRFYLLVLSGPVGYNGWCEGTITPKITIWDTNANGALDLWEKWGENLFDARLSKQCTDPSGGEMDCKWGWGAVASNYFSVKMPPEKDTLYNGMDITLMTGCASATEPSSWGAIKALYK